MPEPTHQPDTLVAQLTPTGRGAIATIAVSGPRALAVVDDCFQPHCPPQISRSATGRIRCGRWIAQATSDRSVSDTLTGEELVVCPIAPGQVEIHCHGGSAAVAAILESLRHRGCRIVDWPELRRARGIPKWQVQAEQALATAMTERTAVWLLAQQQGALAQTVGCMRESLDSGQIDEAQAMCQQLLKDAVFGLHLAHPWQVVIAGAPNVGKSSLINAIMGFERTIVFDGPGTTRDVIHVDAAIDGWPMRITDTAGLRETSDPLESLGISRAELHLAKADLSLIVIDATQLSPVDRPDLALPSPNLQAASPRIIVANKSDLLDAATRLKINHRLSEEMDVVWTSAKTTEGVDQLTTRIANRLIPRVPPDGSGVPFLREHVDLLLRASHELQAGRIESAQRQLDELLR